MRAALADSPEDQKVAEDIITKAFEVYETIHTTGSDNLDLTYDTEVYGPFFVLTLSGYDILRKAQLMSLVNCHPRIKDVGCNLNASGTGIQIWRAETVKGGMQPGSPWAPGGGGGGFKRNFPCKRLAKIPDWGDLGPDDQALARRVIEEVYNIQDKMPTTRFRLADSGGSTYKLIFNTSVTIPWSFIIWMHENYSTRIEDSAVDYTSKEFSITMSKTVTPPQVLPGGKRLVTSVGTGGAVDEGKRRL
jgi:hypothetical protein